MHRTASWISEILIRNQLALIKDELLCHWHSGLRAIVTPQPFSAIKAVGYSDHQRQSGGRAVRNSALTKKVTDEFCLFLKT